jgi:hypothetical protein
MSPRISPAAVYGLEVTIEQLPADLRLNSLEWGVLFAITGRHTMAQIGASLELPDADRDRVFRKLLELGLIAERPLNVREYLRAASTVGGEPRTLASYLSGGIAGPDAEPVVEKKEETNGFEPLPLPPLPGEEVEEDLEMILTDMPNSRPSALSLRAVMRFITTQANGNDAGQLDVYRTFVRVPPQLLQRNGITTLRFEDDRLVSDPDLQQAILTSVQHVLGRPCPPDVFVRG